MVCSLIQMYVCIVRYTDTNELYIEFVIVMCVHEGIDACTHKYIQIDIRTHAHIHTYTQTCIHTYIHTEEGESAGQRERERQSQRERKREREREECRSNRGTC